MAFGLQDAHDFRRQDDDVCRLAGPHRFRGFDADPSASVAFLYGEGVRDFDKYRVDPTASLMPDFFVPDDIPPPPGVIIGEGSLQPHE